MRHLCIVCAHRREAEIIIRDFDLHQNRVHCGPFGYRSIFDSKKNNSHISLIISGEGVGNSYQNSHALNQCTSGIKIWLNFGSGGAYESYGELLAGREVLETDTGLSWHCADWNNMPNSNIHTVHLVQHNYTEGVIYDMEAAGYMRAMSELNNLQQSYCLKLITDCKDNPAGIDLMQNISYLFANQQKNISNCLMYLLNKK